MTSAELRLAASMLAEGDAGRVNDHRYGRHGRFAFNCSLCLVQLMRDTLADRRARNGCQD